MRLATSSKTPEHKGELNKMVKASLTLCLPKPA
jgi:hypothetical protein